MHSHLESSFREKTVLVTGHTGFKGGWLATWLKMLGARVVGFAQPPPGDRPSFFEAAGVPEDAVSILGDVRDSRAVAGAFSAHRPEIVFHLAAQPLVRYSYAEPVETFATNVMGTVHVLEAARQTPSVRVVVVITTDKCYENREWVYAYRENDPLGGHDPYSSSKVAAELVAACYRSSYFQSASNEHPVALASARAGNVIGGGDWAGDRIVPDCIRALVAGQPIAVRNPRAIRPWQHVLEPLSGYLWLAARLQQHPQRYAQAWNFGPEPAGHAAVGELVDELVEQWGAGRWSDVSASQENAPAEATYLKLDCTKAANVLGWKPVLSLPEAIRETVSWYRDYYTAPAFDGRTVAMTQIDHYTAAARTARLPWALPSE